MPTCEARGLHAPGAVAPPATHVLRSRAFVQPRLYLCDRCARELEDFGPRELQHAGAVREAVALTRAA